MVSWLIILLIAFNVTLETQVIFVGRTVNTQEEIVYWDVYYFGIDAANNKQGIKEEVVLRDPPYNGWRARLVALDQLVRKIEAEDEQTLGFIQAIEAGQKYGNF